MKDLEDKDGFWDLDAMLPSVKNKAVPNTHFDTTATDFEVSAPESQHPSGQKLDFSAWLDNRERQRTQKSESVSVYRPKNPLIKSVTVRKPLGRRSSVERFLVNGRLLFAEKGDFQGNVPFYSVYPQYALMSEEQKKCYIGFRSEVRKGNFPVVDEAYIYLYLYENINLCDLMTPIERAQNISALICGYPECDDKLFSDMCNWLADICLIHGLDIPSGIYGTVHPRVLKRARVKEVFIKYNADATDKELYRLMSASGKYDYRMSKYYKENTVYYDKYIENAVCYALSVISKTERRFTPDTDNLLRLTSESFFGAYRTMGVSYTVTLECAALTRSDEEKRTVTELIKYAENCLRSLLGIKQKLTVTYLNREKRQLVKDYFENNAKDVKIANKSRLIAPVTPQIPDYEKLYEPKNEGFTPQSAEQIEQSSWAVTEKLVNAFDDESFDEPCESDFAKNESIIAPVNDQSAVIIQGLRALYEERNADFESFAKNVGMMPMALADEINNFLLDELGDVGVEITDDGFRIAEWYKEDIEQIISEGDK